MTHEIQYREMDIPELDRFLDEYRALCERHGVQFACEEYGYDGGHYVTIEKYTNGAFYLNLDEADKDIPFIARVLDEAHRLNEIKYAKDKEERRLKQEATAAEIERRTISDGVVLSGKKYKLVPER